MTKAKEQPLCLYRPVSNVLFRLYQTLTVTFVTPNIHIVEDRLRNTRIGVWEGVTGATPEFNNYKLCHDTGDVTPTWTTPFFCHDVLTGSYVTLYHYNKLEHIAVCEVKVYANTGT